MKYLFFCLLLVFVSPSLLLATEPLPKDKQGSPIQAITNVIAVSTISITSSSYVAVSVPVAVSCKSIYVKTRAGNSWRLATSSSPSSYILMDSGFSLAIVRTSPSVLFYAKADSTSDTLEILFMD
jgi:hypothetical protein